MKPIIWDYSPEYLAVLWGLATEEEVLTEGWDERAEFADLQL